LRMNLHTHSQANGAISYIFKGISMDALEKIPEMNCYTYYLLNRSMTEVGL
jgi:hypothetical protein